MLPLQISITPTMLIFQDLDHAKIQEMKSLMKNLPEFEYSEKGYFFIKGSEKELFKTLLNLSYTFDIELS